MSSSAVQRVNQVLSGRLETSLPVLSWVLVVLLVVLALQGMQPPTPESVSAPKQDFSADRAMGHVRVIARTSHPIGSEPNGKIRDYLVMQLVSLGLNPQVYPALGLDVVGTAIAAGNTQDIIAYLHGSANSRAILLVAHYDSVPRSPGAADDASGVAAILETVRALRAGGELKNDLMVLFSDGEESGLLGAEAFAALHPWIKNVGLILNFDARGNRGASLLFETSSGNEQLINEVVEAAPYPVGSSLFYALYKMLPNDTDFTVFRRMGIPGLNFAFGAGFQAYHSRLDTLEHLSVASVQHQGSYALALTRHFGQMDLTKLKQQTGDDVFFNWLGGHLVAYSEKWVIPGQAILTALIGLLIALARMNSKIHLSRLLVAALLIMLILVLVSGVLTLIWEAARYFLDSRILDTDITGTALLLTGMILFGTTAAGFLFHMLRTKFSLQEISLAGLGLFCSVNWVLAVKLAAGSYLLFWPLFFSTIGLLVIRLLKKDQQKVWQWTAGLVAAASAILFFAPAIYLVYVFFSLQLLVIITTGFIIGLFCFLSPQLMDALIPEHGPVRILLILCVVGLVCCVWGAMLTGPNAEHPDPDTVAYSLDATDGTARWISYDNRLDKWTTQFFPSIQRQHVPLPDFLAGSTRAVFSASAPALNIPGPVATVLSDEPDGEIHHLHIAVKSLRGTDVLYLRFSKEIQGISANINGRAVYLANTPGWLRLTLYGMAGSEADLKFVLRVPSGISFWVMDESVGLPEFAPIRPASLIAWYGSDVTLVCRKYTLDRNPQL